MSGAPSWIPQTQLSNPNKSIAPFLGSSTKTTSSIFSGLGSSLVGSLAGGAFGLIGGAINDAMQSKQDELNYQRQKEFAQNSLQWKVQDAKKAGLHPLAAIGANSSLYSPTSSAGGGLGDALSNAGQMVSQGFQNRLQEQYYKLSMQRMALENERIKAETNALNRQGQSPQPSQAVIKTPKGTIVNKQGVKLDKTSYYNAVPEPSGYAFVVNPKFSDSADSEYLLKLNNTFNKHVSAPRFWDMVKHTLPKLSNDKKYILEREADGWHARIVDKKESYLFNAGVFTYDPSEKKTDYSKYPDWRQVR